MTSNRTEDAVKRIETALARIAVQADAPAPSLAPSPPPANAPAKDPVAVSNLVIRHEDLRDTVAASLTELDTLIERLQK